MRVKGTREVKLWKKEVLAIYLVKEEIINFKGGKGGRIIRRKGGY